MAIKRIDELGAATPLLTDFLPATPTGGPSTKATVKQLYESNIFAVSVAYTGIAPAPFGAIVSAKSGAQSGSTLTIPDGVTIETFVYSEGLSTTLTYANLAVIRSTFTMATWVNLTSLSFPVLTAIGGSFTPNVMGLLTTLSTPALAYVGGTYVPYNMNTLTSLSAPALAYVGGAYSPTGMDALTTLSAPALTYVGLGFTPSSLRYITTISVPSLVYVGTNFQPGFFDYITSISAPALTYVGTDFKPNTMALLTTLSTPLLEFIGYNLGPYTMAKLTTLSFPALKSVGVNLNRTDYTPGNISPSSMVLLNSFTMPAIEVIGSAGSGSILFVSGTPALATFTMGSTLRRVNGNVNMTSCALLVASVDGVLVSLAALNGTGLTTAYSTKTVTITGTSATPSATGLAAKSTLVARGCTVTHN